MARYVANVDITTETFGTWVIRSNQLLDALSTETITANSTYANTGTPAAQRHARLYGSFTANTLIAETELRGGNTGASGNLNITSNTIITGAAVNVASNATFTANVTATGANVYFNITQFTVNSNTSITGRVVSVVSNTQTFNSNSSVTAIAITGNSSVTNTAVGGTDLNIAANVSVTGSSLVSTANITSTAATTTLKSNSSITVLTYTNNGTSTDITVGGNNATITSNVIMSGTNHTVAGNVNFDSGTVFVDATNNRLGVNTATPDATLTVAGTANVSGVARFANTVAVIGAATFSNTVAVTNTATFSNTVSIAGITTFKTDYVVDVFANSNLGTGTVSPLEIYSFTKSAYKTAKLMVQASNTGGTFQMAEMAVAHDGTTPYITVYGVVPASAPIGDFSVSSNTTHIIVNMLQTENNCATKVVAHLIK